MAPCFIRIFSAETHPNRHADTYGFQTAVGKVQQQSAAVFEINQSVNRRGIPAECKMIPCKRDDSSDFVGKAAGCCACVVAGVLAVSRATANIPPKLSNPAAIVIISFFFMDDLRESQPSD